MRVLIVEDDVDLADILAEEVSELGHEVMIARSGQEAMTAVAQFAADVALVDVGLPDISGITLVSLLRGLVEHASLRVIGMSGLDRVTLDAASERGIFDDHLAKPVTVAELERALSPS